ncbi:MAG TPA: hypothetical protein VGS21_02450, partial [Acidimicrobiales bacterium]|nr:hypothetical protein [Acidimicrobiales bacterium]
VRLSCDALDTHTVAVFLNRFDPDDDLHRANRDFLAADGYLIVTSVEELADIVLGGAAAV